MIYLVMSYKAYFFQNVDIVFADIAEDEMVENVVK